jgi:hypothetical protein
VLAASLLAAAVPAAALEGNVNVFAGRSGSRTPTGIRSRSSRPLGIQLAFGQLRSPIHFAVDVFYAHDDATVDQAGVGTTKVEGGSTEYAIGVRKVFRRQARSTPTSGAAPRFSRRIITVESPAGRAAADDSDFGYWIDGGVTWRLGAHFNLGSRSVTAGCSWSSGTCSLRTRSRAAASTPERWSASVGEPRS